MRAYSIQEARDKADQLTALFLRQVNGPELSELLPQLKGLKILDLSDNQLDQLPKGVESLESLEHLILNNNRLRTLPRRLPASLKKLEARYNALEQWPEALLHLPQLQVLDLSGNFINEFSLQDGQLQDLRFLSLHNNKIKSVPSDWKSLKSLRILDLSTNHIRQIPAIFSQLKELEKVNMSYNEIGQIPSGIGQCKQLSDLSLQYNNLSKLPAGLFKLSFLRSLSLAHNNLKSLPGRIRQWSWLAQLDLSHNQLSRLPSGIGDCQQLQSLTLHNNRLSSLPTAIGQLDKLQKLQLHNNHLKRLPKLPLSLKELSIAGNSFTLFPSSLCKLNRLKELNLSENPIKKLPGTVNKLESLTRVYLQKPSASFDLFSFLHLPPVETIKCDRLSEDQRTLLVDILRLSQQMDLSFKQKKELFSFSGELSKLTKSTLVRILNHAEPTLSYSIRKKLLTETTDLPPGSEIGIIGQSSAVLNRWKQKFKDWELNMSTPSSSSTHFLLGEPPYPSISEKEIKDQQWLNLRRFLDLLHSKNDSGLSADQKRTIERLLMSEHTPQNKLGIQLIYGVGMDDMLWGFLFRIFREKPESPLREEIYQLLLSYANEGHRRDLLLNVDTREDSIR